LVPSCFAIFTFEPLTLSLTSMPSCDLESLTNILILCLILKASDQSLRKYGYIKNHMKTVKNKQARTRESEEYKAEAIKDKPQSNPVKEKSTHGQQKSTTRRQSPK
ncbi:hypothetical protein Tco_1522615, partial [Tanacetum coccineum]